MKNASTKTQTNRSNSTRQIAGWFKQRNWKIFAFQRECWKTFDEGRDFLLHSSTGSGKTLAAWLGPVGKFLREQSVLLEAVAKVQAATPRKSLPTPTGWVKRRGHAPSPPLTVLWITPLRALSADTEKSLREPISDLKLPWTVETRTGDTSASLKTRLRKHPPTALITTPESLTGLLSYPDSFNYFRTLECIVVDEWHELLGTKRGIQTELALARLRRIAPKVVTCGLSATIGNMHSALASLTGIVRHAELTTDSSLAPKCESCNKTGPQAKIILGKARRSPRLTTLLPDSIGRFPWAGHLGLSMAEKVAQQIASANCSLVFVNTRNQAETWYRSILKQRSDWAGLIGLHHGSLDSRTRNWVENAARHGKLKAIVCTSSLDLGIDFSSIDQVLQIGSPKGIWRLIQRAGRSGHSPTGTSRVVLAPTHALELVDFAAAKEAIGDHGALEERTLYHAPLDCLIQHLMTMILARPATRDELASEIRSTFAYRDLSDEDLDWALHYLVHGGQSLRAYPDFHKLDVNDGKYAVTSSKIARLHRLSIGTIVGEMNVEVRFLNGKRIGTVEESFISRIEVGDVFYFGGKSVELVQLREGTAMVRSSKKSPTVTMRWAGSRMPFSSELAAAIREQFHRASLGSIEGVDMNSLREILNVQSQWSRIPGSDELLIESYLSRGRQQIVFFPIEGYLVHEGLCAVIAHRIGQLMPNTLTMTCNDYGLLLECNRPLALSESKLRELLRPMQLNKELLGALNATEIAKRQFREIARISGLIHPGYPGQPKRARHLQASSNMFFDTFERYEPGNLLVQQAREEVLDRQLDWSRLSQCLQAIQGKTIRLETPRGYTPLAFPLGRRSAAGEIQ